MSKVLVTESHLEDMADAIRAKLGTEATYLPEEMAGAIGTIPSEMGTKSVTANGTYRAGDDGLDGYSEVAVAVPVPTLVNKSVTANGTYNPADDGAGGYSRVSVSVPNSYASGDEGKVVQNGELVAQTSLTVTENDTYDTTTKRSVTVNVSGGGGGGASYMATATQAAEAGTAATAYDPSELSWGSIAALEE